MSDQYRLLAGISSGRVDTDDHGPFEIQNGECTVDDYETAALLVRRYSLLGWEDGDPGQPGSEAEDEDEGEGESEIEDEDETLEAEPEIEPEPESEAEAEAEPDSESAGVIDEGDADADAEAEVARDDEGREIYTCAGMDGDCTRRVEEPGGYCWQHED